VIVAHQNRIVMEPTLDLALARLFGQTDRAAPQPAKSDTTTTAAATGTPAPAASPGFDRLATEARESYQRALEAQRAGDWAKYGEEIKRLGELLEKMRSPR
jgi:uncharacterized protein